MFVYWTILCLACSEEKTDTAEEATSEPAADNIEGSNCTYNDYEGTCVYEDAGFFTYNGIIEGEEVSFPENPYTLGPEENSPASGTSVDCTLSYITSGNCTPCIIDIGECGSEAFSGFSEHSIP